MLLFGADFCYTELRAKSSILFITTLRGVFCYSEVMIYFISQLVGWIATFFRASGMLVKKPMSIKLLVSTGNALWALSGALTGNIPLIVSNVLCLAIMAIELIRNRKKK